MKKTSSPQKMPAVGAGNAEKLIRDLASGKYKNVVIMVGAGISTAAGIPDFRSPGTGLYANLAKLNLPFPEAVFDIDYFREKPEAFYVLAKGLYPGNFNPTSFHRFISWVSELGVLRRVYTQNIDTLERIAGVHPDKIVEAHGSFAENHCIECGKTVDGDTVKKAVEEEKPCRCPACGGLVKPDIVFFGEALPARYFDCIDEDFDDDVDLCIVAGTSLQVFPFAQLPELVESHVPRWLFNMERVGSFGDRKNDTLVLGSLGEFPEIEGVLVTEKDGNAKYVFNAETESSSPSKPSKKKDAPKEKQEGGDNQVHAKVESKPKPAEKPNTTDDKIDDKLEKDLEEKIRDLNLQENAPQK